MIRLLCLRTFLREILGRFLCEKTDLVFKLSLSNNLNSPWVLILHIQPLLKILVLIELLKLDFLNYYSEYSYGVQ